MRTKQEWLSANEALLHKVNTRLFGSVTFTIVRTAYGARLESLSTDATPWMTELQLHGALQGILLGIRAYGAVMHSLSDCG